MGPGEGEAIGFYSLVGSLNMAVLSTYLIQ